MHRGTSIEQLCHASQCSLPCSQLQRSPRSRDDDQAVSYSLTFLQSAGAIALRPCCAAPEEAAPFCRLLAKVCPALRTRYRVRRWHLEGGPCPRLGRGRLRHCWLRRWCWHCWKVDCWTVACWKMRVHGGGDLKGGSEGPRVPWGSEARSMAAASALPRDLAVGRHRGVSISVTRMSSSWLTRALRGPASRRAAANEAQRCCSRSRCCSSHPRRRSRRRAPRRWRR